MMCNEQCYSLAVEKLLGIDIPERAKFIRTMFGGALMLWPPTQQRRRTNRRCFYSLLLQGMLRNHAYPEPHHGRVLARDGRWCSDAAALAL